MFALRSKYNVLVPKLRQFVTPAFVARHPFLRRAGSTSKSIDQLDIDKKNGVLAYVPFGSDFELTPLSGIAIRFLEQSIDNGKSSHEMNAQNKEKIAEEIKVNRDV